jgi:hypothetical protein
MKKVIQLIVLLIISAVSPGLKAANYVVSGAGSNVNGTYDDNGLTNAGHPFYVMNTNNVLALVYDGKWKIASIEPVYGSGGATVITTYYYTNDEGSTPPSTGWTVSSGVSPVPVVKPETAQILYSSLIFSESPENDGTIDNTIAITYNNQAGDTFTGINGDDFVAAGKVAVSHLPAGLTARILRTGNLSLVAVLTGSAYSHKNTNDISNLTFTFKNSAFVGGDVSSVANFVKRDLSVNFIQIINVGSTGDYTTITAALAAARDGDILNLAAQTFTESGLTIGDINNLATYLRNVTLQGQGAQATIIQGAASSGLAAGPVFMLDIQTTVTMKNLTIRNGNSFYGGGIYSGGTRLNLVNVDINNNTATDYGGGIYITGGSVVSIMNSTIHHNSGGSGVYVISGSASVVNSTIAYNSGVSSIGGGLTCDYSCSLELINCSVNLNQGTGISALGSGNITMANTMLIGNIPADYKVYNGVTLTDNGYNIVERQASSNVSGNWRFTHANDILWNLTTSGSASTQWTRNNAVLDNQSVDLGTELLDNSTQNGTQTIAIGSSSFAVNAGTNAGAPGTDQRGKSRNGTTDIGAYEYNGVAASVPTLTTTAISIYNGVSATLGGVVSSDGGATVTERGVVYSLSGTPDISDTKVQIGSGTGTFSLSVTGLLWGTRYSVRAYAINAAAIVYGSVQTFVTTPLPPTITSTPVTTAVYDQGYIYNIQATTEGGQSTVCSAPTKPDWLTFRAAQSKATSIGPFNEASYLGGIAGDDKGNIYVLPKGGTTIYIITADGTTSVWKSGLVGVSSQIRSLHVANGYLYIPKNDAVNTITRIPLNDPTATEETFASISQGAGDLIDKDGWIYTTVSTPAIIRINETTKEQQVFLDTSDGLPSNGPHGLTFGLDGNLYIVEWSNGNILKYDGTSISSVGPTLGDWLTSIRQDPEGNFYVSTYSSGIWKFDSNFMNYQSVSANSNDCVYGMSMTPSGALIYARFTTNLIYRLQTCAVLTGVPSKSQLGNYPVVVRATNSGGYTEQTFTVDVVDNIKPVITALSPADGSTGIFLNPTLSVTFDEEVSLSAAGTLSLQSGGTTLVSYNLSSSSDRNAFTLSGDQLTLSFPITNPLPKNSLIGVQISEGFIKDLNGNDFAGITIASGAWNFTTTPGYPVISNLNSDSGSFTQGTSPLILDNGTNASLYDPDASVYNGGNMTVAVSSVSATENLSIRTSGSVSLSTGMAAGSVVSVSSTAIGTIASVNDGQAGNNLVVTFNANATDARISTLIQNLTYSNTSKILLGTRSVSVTVTDASALSSSAAVVSVTTFDINDAPTLTAASLNPSYLEQATAEKLFSAASASTVESGQTITGLTLTIDNLADGSSEKLSLDGSAISLTDGTTGTSTTNSLAYSVSVSASTATVTVSGGSLTVAKLQTLVNAISYSNTSNTPTGTSRVATITSLTDNGGTANGGQDTGTLAVASTVTIVPKDPPTLTTASITSIDIHSATMGGNVTAAGYSSVTSRGVVYSKSDHTPTLGFSNSLSAANGSGSGSFSALITGLLDGTAYYVRAYATNAEGTSYGSVETFTTPNGPITFSSVPSTVVPYGHTYNYNIVAPQSGSLTNTLTAPTLPGWLSLKNENSVPVSFGNIPAGNTITHEASDKEGNVYAVMSNGSIYKIIADGTTTLWGSGFGSIASIHICNEYLYFGDDNLGNSIQRVPLNNPTAVPETFFSGSSLNWVSVATDKDGWIYILKQVYKQVNSTYEIINLYVYKINESTGVNLLYIDLSGLNLTSLTFGQDGYFYFGFNLTQQRHYVYKYDGSTSIKVFPIDGSEFSYPVTFIHQGTDNSFYLSVSNSGIRKYTSDFSSFVDFSSENTYNPIYTPSGALVYSDAIKSQLYLLQIEPVLTGIPARSDVGSHPAVLRATNNLGYTEQSFTINVTDAIKPVISALSPADGATGVTLNPTMSVTFDEEVSLGTSGTLTLKNGITVLKSFDLSIADDRNALTLSENQKTLSFSLPNLLPSNSEIGVEISDGFVKDLSGTAFAGITIASGTWSFTTMLAQNPDISNLNGDSGSFKEGDSPLLIDNGADATITDTNSSGFAGGNLTVAIGSVSATESLSIKTSATVVLSSGMAAGSTVSIGGTAIGILATGKDGQAGHDLVVTLNANATTTRIGTLIQNITYSNNSEFDLGSRTVAVTVQDAFVYTSSASNVTITTSVVNDPPTLTITGVYPTFTEHGQPVKVYSGATASTVESGQLFTGFSFNVTNLPDGASEQVVIDGNYVVLTNGTTGTTGTNSLSYTVSVGGLIAVVTVSGGSLSAVNLQLVLNNLSYYNPSSSPSTSPNRLFKFLSLKDDGGTANGGNNTALFGLTIPSSVTVVATNLPTVTTTGVATYNSTSAILGGNVTADGGATVSERGVVYSSSDNTPTIDETGVAKDVNGTTGTGTFSKSVTGLTRGTTYYVQAYATSVEGTAYGSMQSFTTIGLPTVSTTAVTTYYGTTATLGGNASADGGATVTERGVVYSSVDNTPTIGETDVTKNVNGTTGTGTFSKSVTGLTRGTTYYVCAYATSAEGTSYGSMQSFTTITLPTVLTIAITTYDGFSATLGGNVTADGGATVTERGVVYTTSHNTTTIGEPNVTKDANGTTGTGTFSESVTGLTRGTTYYVRAYATSTEGTAYGSLQSFTTMGLPTVSTAAITTYDGVSATLDGNVSSDGGATVTERGIVYSSVDNTPAIGETDVAKNADGTLGTGTFSKSVTGLTRGTTYYVRAYAINAEGTVYGSMQSFTTNTLPTVSTTVVTTYDGVSATLGGNVSSDGGATVSERGVVYSSVDHTPTIGETDVTKNVNGTTGTETFSKSVTGLLNGTTYYVQAYATNSEGTSYGSVQSFTTQALPSVTTTAITTYTSTSASLGGHVTADGGATVIERGVVYSASDATPTIAEGGTKVAIGSGTGTYSQSVVSLSSLTLFYVNAYATNSIGTSYGTAVSFTTIAANSAPTDIALSASAINENATANSTVGTLSSTDADTGNTFTYTLVSGTGSTDNASFNISGSNLQITNSPDYETKSSYSVRVRTTDQGSLYTEKVFTITITNVNEAPADIALSASAINENVTANSSVGTFSSTDPDTGNTFTYTLVSGTGSTNNASFNISGSSLRITNSPDYETKSSYTVRVRTNDQGSLYTEKAFTITITNVNESPTDIALSASAIDENVAANSTVGTLSSTDTDTGNTFTYTLVSGTGSTDNASFNISGSNLHITNSPDFETKSSYSVRIRSTDQGGLYYEKYFTITINDVNELPSTSNAGADQIKCNNSSFTLEGNNPSVGSGEWSLVSGTASITSASSYNSAATVASGNSATLRWTISNSPYTPSTDDVVLTNKAATAITSQSTAAQTQCLNGSFSAITLTTTGSNLSYQWYSNADQIASGGYAVGTSANTYTPSAATAGTLYYYCVVTGNCGTETSTISGAFVVRAAFTAGEISNITQTICTVGTPTEISSTMDASGGNGSVTYRWQSSTDAGFSSPTDISSNTATYTPISGLAVTTWYHRQAKDGVCNTNWSTSANVTQIAVNTTSFTPIVRHVSDLTATGENIKWYAAASGGTALASTDVLPTGTTHYYASQTVNSVESAARLDVTVTVDSTPCAPGGTASQTYSIGATIASLQATGSGIRWYAALSGGTALAASTLLVNGTHYYASQSISCTESANRLEVVVTIN